jgi:hypothetical protein
MSTPTPDADGIYHGIGDLAAKGSLGPFGPYVIGHWGPMGFGWTTKPMREAALAILAACDDADALAAGLSESDRQLRDIAAVDHARNFGIGQETP